MNLDMILWLSGILAEAAVIVLCIRAKLFPSMPVFCSYLIWSLFVDLLLYSVNKYSPTHYFHAYELEMSVDALFQFAVLLELGWNVLSPIRTSLPKRSILILALLIVVAGAVIWPIVAQATPQRITSSSERFFIQLQQTFAVLRVTIFIALAGFSQMLSIGWRNRELQIATGLGFYSMFSLAVSVIHLHQALGPHYYALDQLGVASYVCSLGYWIFSFAQQEEERHEFTPQMRSFLLTVTGAARGARLAVADARMARPHKNGDS